MFLTPSSTPTRNGPNEPAALGGRSQGNRRRKFRCQALRPRRVPVVVFRSGPVVPRRHEGNSGHWNPAQRERTRRKEVEVYSVRDPIQTQITSLSRLGGSEEMVVGTHVLLDKPPAAREGTVVVVIQGVSAFPPGQYLWVSLRRQPPAFIRHRLAVTIPAFRRSKRTASRQSVRHQATAAGAIELDETHAARFAAMDRWPHRSPDHRRNPMKLEASDPSGGRTDAGQRAAGDRRVRPFAVDVASGVGIVARHQGSRIATGIHRSGTLACRH